MTSPKESAKQRNEAHEQSGSSSSEQRDGCSHTVATFVTSRREPGGPGVQNDGNERDGSISRPEWMVHCGGIFSVISETFEDKSHFVDDEECMVAMVTNGQEREDVSTTALDGEVNPRWLTVCKTWSKKMRTEAQEALDWNAVHNIDEDKITITINMENIASVPCTWRTESVHFNTNTGGPVFQAPGE